MKILAIGDQHFKLDMPYAAQIPDRRQGEKQAVINKLHELSKSVDFVVLMGDNLNSRHNHSTVLKEFTNFLKGFGEKQVIILAGNHEIYNGSETALDFLSAAEMPNWRVIKEPTVIGSFGYLPYMTNAALGVGSFQEATEKIVEHLGRMKEQGAEFIFHHHAVSSSYLNDAVTTDSLSEVVIPREYLEENFKLSTGGHIHKPQRKKNVIVTGSTFTMEIGEKEKYAWEIDSDTVDVTKHLLPNRMIVKVLDEDELDKYPKNSIIKFVATDLSQDIEAIEEKLQAFDAYILVEDYPNTRKRARVFSGGSLDLSVPNLLKLYAEQKEVDLDTLLKGYEIITEDD